MSGAVVMIKIHVTLRIK